MYDYHVIIRSQKSVGSSGTKFGGPDTYFLALRVPEGAKVPKVMRRDLLRARGIAWKYCGEGYSRHQGSRSSYMAGVLRAEKQIEKWEQEDQKA